MLKTKQIEKTSANFNDILDFVQTALMSRLNCHGIGKIVEFDKNTQTATIQLMQLKQFAETFYTPAPLTEVPLIIYGTPNAYITLPDLTDSICLVFFIDRNIDNFIQTGEMYAPETSRMHDFTDCIAITTFKTLVDSIENYDENAITLYYEKLVSEVAYSAVIKNFASSILLQMTGNGNTSKFNIAQKFNMQNSEYSLAQLIQDLIQAIKDIVVNLATGALTQSSIDALDEVAEDFKGLLE